MTTDPVAFTILLCREAALEPFATDEERREAAAAADRLAQLQGAERVTASRDLEAVLEDGPFMVEGRMVRWR